MHFTRYNFEESLLPLREKARMRDKINSASSPQSSPVKGEEAHKPPRRNRLTAKRLSLSVVLVLGSHFAYSFLATAATRDLEKVRAGYSVGGLIPFPAVVAKENRLFEQLGLEVELINIPPTLAVTALVSGDLQYVIFAGTTLNAAVRGLPVKLVMVYNDRPLFSLMSRPEYRSI